MDLVLEVLKNRALFYLHFRRLPIFCALGATQNHMHLIRINTYLLYVIPENLRDLS